MAPPRVSDVQDRLSALRLGLENQQQRSSSQLQDQNTPPLDAFAPEYAEPAGQQDELGNGWVRIRLGRDKTPVVIGGMKSIPEHLSTGIMRMEYNEAARLWRTSASRETIANAVKHFLDKRPDWKCSFAVCISIGSLSRGDASTRQVSMYQLAAFLDIVLQLPPEGDEKASIPVLYQEKIPKLTAMDVAFLQMLDIDTYQVPHDDDSFMVGGYLTQRSLDHRSFIFEAGVDGLVNFVEKFERINPDLLVSSLHDTTDLMRMIVLRDEAAKTRRNSDIDRELSEELQMDVDEGMQIKKFRGGYDLMRFPDLEVARVEHVFGHLKLLCKGEEDVAV